MPDTFSSEQLDILRALTIASSTLSVIGSSANIARLFSRRRKSNKDRLDWSFRHRLILYLSLSDFVSAASELIFSLISLGRPVENTLPAWSCNLNGFLIQASVVFTDYLILFICVHSAAIILIVSVNSFEKNLGIEPYEKYVMAFISLCAFGTSAGVLAGQGFSDVGSWCWVGERHIVTRAAVSYIPRFVIIVLLLFLYGAIGMRVYSHYSSQRHLTPQSKVSVRICMIGTTSLTKSSANNTVEVSEPMSSHSLSPIKLALLRKLALYPLAYIALWVAPTVNRALDIVRNGSGHAPAGCFGWTASQAFLSPLHGFVDALVYGLVETRERRDQDSA